MNAGGHIAVVALLAERSGRKVDGAQLLGAALPDLAAMGRFRLVGKTDDEAVTRGIALHHRTDELFHRHAWFRDRNRSLTAMLSEAGLGRGPSMACSHVGIELLLDGELLKSEMVTAATTAAFDAIEERSGDLLALVEEPHRARWRMHLQRLSDHRLPIDYHDPQAVAARLHRILASRPRLRLPEHQVPVVARSLEGRKAAIDATAADLVDDLSEALS